MSLKTRFSLRVMKALKMVSEQFEVILGLRDALEVLHDGKAQNKKFAPRSEKAGVNGVRLLTELFKQPTLRESEENLRLLIPPLLTPLLELLCPE